MCSKQFSSYISIIPVYFHYFPHFVDIFLPERVAVKHPDGRIYDRPGEQHPEVYDDTAPLEAQQNYIRKRVVENHQNIPRNIKVVGDPIILQGRIASSAERMKTIFNDDIRPLLDNTTRSSPIYKDTNNLAQRTSRVILPADTQTSLSITPGLLHAYRMHHVRMHMMKKRKRFNLLKTKYDAAPIRPVDVKMPHIEGIDNELLQEYVTYFGHMAKIHLDPRVAPALTEGLKKVIPLVLKMDTQEVVHVRRRRK